MNKHKRRRRKPPTVKDSDWLIRRWAIAAKGMSAHIILETGLRMAGSAADQLGLENQFRVAMEVLNHEMDEFLKAQAKEGEDK